MSDLSVILVPSDLQWPGWEEVLGPVFSTLVMHGSAAGLENWVQTPKARKLPPAWSEGSVTGLRARGGFVVDIAWKDGKATRWRIAAAEPREVKIRVNGETKTVTAEKL